MMKIAYFNDLECHQLSIRIYFILLIHMVILFIYLFGVGWLVQNSYQSYDARYFIHYQDIPPEFEQNNFQH